MVTTLNGTSEPAEPPKKRSYVDMVKSYRAERTSALNSTRDAFKALIARKVEEATQDRNRAVALARVASVLRAPMVRNASTIKTFASKF